MADQPQSHAPIPIPIPIPGDTAEVHFHAPWQARAFALTVHLHAQGAFGWTEWAQALSTRIGAADTGAATLPTSATSEDHANAYYRAWLMALSDLVQAKGLAEADMIRDMARTWQRAAEATPHGTPILYEAGE